MNACQRCSTLGCPDEPLASCDGCSVFLCKTCADLSSTELRAVVLKKRSKSIIYLCDKCQPCPSDLGLSKLKDSMLELIKQQFANFAESLIANFALELETKISVVKSEVSVLRESNIDLIKLFTSQKPLALKPTSNTALLDNSKAPSVRGQGTKSSVNNGLSVSSQQPNKTTLTLPPRRNSPRTHFTSPNLQEVVPPKSDSHDVGTAIDKTGVRSEGRQAGNSRSTTNVNFIPMESVRELPKNDSQATGSSVLVGDGQPMTGERWTEVRPRRLNRKQKYGTGSTSDGLAAFIPQTDVHVSKVGKDYDGNKVVSYIKSQSNEAFEVGCEELQVKSGAYRSYKLTVPVTYCEKLLDSSFWPSGIAVRKFVNGKPRRLQEYGREQLAGRSNRSNHNSQN